MEAGDAPPPFPTETTNTSGRAGPVLGGGPSVREQNDQGDTARETTKGRQNAGNRDSTSAGQVVTPRTAPIAPTATPAAAKSTPRCGGRGKPAARGRRGRPRGTGIGPRASSAGQGDGTRGRRRPRPGHSAPPSPEGDQGGRVADTGSPCTYYGEDLDFSGGDPVDSQAPVPVACSHEGFVCARCMWDRAEHLANG